MKNIIIILTRNFKLLQSIWILQKSLKVEQSLRLRQSKIIALAKQRKSKSSCVWTPIVIECSHVRRRCRSMQELTQVNGPTSVTNANSLSLNSPHCKNTSEFMNKASRTNARSVDEPSPKWAIWSATDVSTPVTNPTSVKYATRSLVLGETWASTCRSIKVKKCHTNAQSAKRHISTRQAWESISRQCTNKWW